MVIKIYPLMVNGWQAAPRLDLIVARAVVGAGRGELRVFVRQHETGLRQVFEQPLSSRTEPDRVLAPWSPEAIDQILRFELNYLGLVSVVQEE